MSTVQKPPIGKNELWVAYQADPVAHAAIVQDLKNANLFRHWLSTASKEGHDLKNAKAVLRDIFMKHLPETAKLFGLVIPKGSSAPKAKVPSPAPLFEQP
jgi:hypothetical protein